MKTLTLNQVTLCADGSIGLQWLKQLVDNGEVLFSEPHRTSVEFDGDVATQMNEAFAHLADMGYAASEEERLAHRNRVVAIDRIARRDPAIEAARKEKIEQRNAAQSAG